MTTINKTKKDTACDEVPYCGIGFGYMVLLGIAITGFVAVVYGIIGLINISNDELQEKCPKSSIWAYVLVYTILFALNIIKAKNQKEGDICTAIIGLMQVFGYSIWGNIEIYGIASDCTSIHTKAIYLSAYMILSIMNITSIICVLGAIGFIGYNMMIFCDCCKKKPEKNTPALIVNEHSTDPVETNFRTILEEV